MADAGEVEIPQGVKQSGLSFELLFAGAQEGDEVDLASFVGLLQGAGLSVDEGEELVPRFGDEGDLGGHILAGGSGFVADARGEGMGLKVGAFSGGGFFGDLALVTVPEGQWEREAEADKAGALGAEASDILPFTGGEEACAEVLPAPRFGEFGLGVGGVNTVLGELKIGARLPRTGGGEKGCG